MARIFITGSSDGLGLMAGRLLADEGHAVVLHGRSDSRAAATRLALPTAESVVVGDLSTVAAMHDVADQANALGRFDAVIHNVGIGYREPRRVGTVDGLSQLWAVNVLAPYVLTALMERPARLVYLSSGMHLGAGASHDDLQWSARRWNGSQAYAETKLQDVLLAFGVARRWPDVYANALAPGWVPTRMGGSGATDDLDQGHRTQAWLAVGDDAEARTTAGYFYHQRPSDVHPAVRDAALQDRLLEACERCSRVSLPDRSTS